MYSSVVEKFLRYVKIDTQSEDGVEQIPSTEKQRNLGNVLVKELQEMGVPSIDLDEEHGYVYASIPSNMDKECPAIAFIAHMDTSDAISGENVKPRIIENYDGKDIVLDAEKNIVTAVKDFKILPHYAGKTMIVTDGSTLLGGDDKAGVAEIMTMVEYFCNHPEEKHGKICIAFTPDEEVGRGTVYFDLNRLGADFGYTVDGGELGDLSYENFNGAGVTLNIHGVSVHPGEAKNIMKNALTIACEFHNMLPANECPECTEGYEGFYHLTDIEGTSDQAVVKYIIRDHDKKIFEKRKENIYKITTYLNDKYGYEVITAEVKDSYYNMKEVVEKDMHIIDHAIEAMKKLDIKPLVAPIRGGTDGANLSFKGLCCPNLGTGSEGHHGRHEFACVESMEGTTELIKEIIKLYAENAK